MKKEEMMKKLIALYISTQAFLLSACGSNVYENLSNERNVSYDAGEHVIVQIDSDIDRFGFGREGRFSISAPAGYRVADYDYDLYEQEGKDSSSYYNYYDYVYVNEVPVYAKNPNKFGEPTEEVEQIESNVYPQGRHVIVDISRNWSFLYGKNNVLTDITAPAGYDILDYDYDKTSYWEFETITYVNNQDVTISNRNNFGTPINNTEERDYYETGEHTIVSINRNINFGFGRKGIRSLSAPAGYRIIDYDYDKDDSLEFETIVYENIVPVTKEKNNFGTPLEAINDTEYEENIYEAGQHVLVKIDRGFDASSPLFFTGASFEAPHVEGYDLLDYDYDRSRSLDFQTYVYVNNQRVEVTNENDFGTVLDRGRTLSR